MVTASERMAEGIRPGCVCCGAIDHDKSRVSCSRSSWRHSLLRHAGFCPEPTDAHVCHPWFSIVCHCPGQRCEMRRYSESRPPLLVNCFDTRYRKRTFHVAESCASYFFLSMSTPRPDHALQRTRLSRY